MQDLTGMTIKGIMYIYFCEFLVTRQSKPPIILFMEWSHWNYNAWGSYGSYTIGKANKCCPGNIKNCIRIYLNLITMLTLMCIAGNSTFFLLHACKNTAEKHVPDCKRIFPAIAQVKNTKNGSDYKGTNPVQSQDRHHRPSKEQLLLYVKCT